VSAIQTTGTRQTTSSAAVEAPLVPLARAEATCAPSRLHVGRWFLLTDLGFSVGAYWLALQFRDDVSIGLAGHEGSVYANWSMLVPFVITFFVFYALGLYERELLSLRALHVVTLAKAMLWSAAISTLVMYLFHLPIAFQSRLLVVGTFALFFVFATIVRAVVLTRALSPRFREDMGGTLVVGWPYRTEPLRERLTMLRGFNRVTLVDVAREQRIVSRVAEHLRARTSDGRRRFGSLFVDAGSLTPTQSLNLISLGHRYGATVYVVSNRLRPLTGRRLLVDLFEAPVVRVRRVPGVHTRAPAKRLFDVLGASATIVVLSPLMLAIALAVKVSSAGPVLYAQERVGLDGIRFKFFKFRTMQDGCDASEHREYVQALINGEAQAKTQSVEGEQEDVFKLVDDSRVTKLGRLLRRYSLDELPQFWNVLVGDMSLVGPRPPLSYEVAAYQPWHCRRLEVKPGITGVWQVDGRCRVSFDDMVFQDILYDCSRDALVDASLCLRTIPAAVLGHGAA
jgi:lipopolysaccharide/colanic/teichoic acid biosynthesis glycosyltransferase